VGMLLDGNCRDDPGYTYEKLNVSDWYPPPSKTHAGDMTCDCDTVMYSLIMACINCQGGLEYGWEGWATNCDTVLISAYSGTIPPGTAIPHWAFYNVTLLNDQQYDDNNAQSIGRDPEATPSVSSSTSNTKSKGIPKQTAAIIGGVVGGVGFLIIVTAAYCLYQWWHMNKENNQQAQLNGTGGYASQWKMAPVSPVKHTPSVSTGQTLAPNRLFHTHLPASMPELQGGRPVTWVTSMPNGGQR